MSVIRKISLKDALGTDVVYDIGAEAANVKYDTDSTVKDVLDDLDGHPEAIVNAEDGVHGIRYLNNQLQLWDSTNEVWVNKIQLDNLTFYVDGVNGNDTNAGTQAAPFATITKAVSMIGNDSARAATAQIFVADGIYTENITIAGKNISISGINGGSANVTLNGAINASNFARVYLNKIKINLSSIPGVNAVVAGNNAFVVSSGGIEITGDGSNTGFYAHSNGVIHVAQSKFTDIDCAFKADGGIIRVSNNPTFVITDTGALVTNGGIIHLRSDISALSGVTTPYDTTAAYGGRIFTGNSSMEQMRGATSTADGASGAVPKPLIADREKFLKGDGTWAEIEAGDKAAELIAPIEENHIATRNYAAGDQFILDEKLYTATRAISIGDAIRTEATKNLLPNNIVAETVDGISFSKGSNGTIGLLGTGTDSGMKDVSTFTLPAGSYTLTSKVDGSASGINLLGIYLEDVNDDTWHYECYEGTPTTFTLTTPRTIKASVDYSAATYGSGGVSDYLYPMIRLSTDTDDTYEEYLGGANCTLSDTIVEQLDDAGSNFIGTQAQWDALSADEKAKYKTFDRLGDLAGNGVGGDMIGATSTLPGSHGLVPAPAAGDEEKFLRGDGTWAEGGGGGSLIAVPTVTDTEFNYDGIQKGPTITRDTAHTILTGTTRATEFGDYSFTISLSKASYIWSDGTIAPKVYEWNINLDGKTITPINDIQTWLHCANIKDKTYTTLSQVLNDHETLYTLINSDNAMDYLVRSTNWVSTVTADATAMNYIGHKNYASDTLLADSTWRAAICDSTYFESVLNTKVPVMASDSASIIKSSVDDRYSDYWKAFDNNWTKSSWTEGWYSTRATDQYYGYDFGESVAVKKILFRVPYAQVAGGYYDGVHQYRIEYSDDGITYYSATELITYSQHDQTTQTVNLDVPISARYWRMFITKNDGGIYFYITLLNLQFYGRSDVTENQIDIYSAANDTVYYLDNGSPVTVCTTDTAGHGTVSKSSLPAGTYTLYSSVAKDPDNLSNDYSKSVTVSDGTAEIKVMPDGVLYWWGFKNITIARSDGAQNVTYNDATNSITYGFSSALNGVGCKITFASTQATSVNKRTLIYSAQKSSGDGSCSISTNGTNGVVVYGSSSSASINMTKFADTLSSSLVVTDTTVSLDSYNVSAKSIITIYALWYE